MQYCRHIFSSFNLFVVAFWIVAFGTYVFKNYNSNKKKCGRILKACCIYFIIDITRTILIPVVLTPQWKKKRIIQIQNGKKNDAILFTVNFIVSPIVDWIGFEILNAKSIYTFAPNKIKTFFAITKVISWFQILTNKKSTDALRFFCIFNSINLEIMSIFLHENIWNWQKLKTKQNKNQ